MVSKQDGDIQRSGMTEVDVIVPTYNRSEYLQCAIWSVLNQTFEDLTLIVVDDASEDDTPSVVKHFNDKRIKYIRHAANCGEAFARNTGLSAASAAFVAFLDDDDGWLSEKRWGAMVASLALALADQVISKRSVRFDQTVDGMAGLS